MDFAAVTWPVSASYAIAHAVSAVSAALLHDGTTNGVRDRMVDFAAFNGLIGLEQVRDGEAACDDFARDLLEHRAAEDGGGLSPASSGPVRHSIGAAALRPLHGKVDCP